MTDFVTRFDVEFAPKLGMRAPTFRAVIREFLTHKGVSIVETGCTRQKDNWLGDGQSTRIWSALTKWQNIGSFRSVDNDEEACRVASECLETSAYSSIMCLDSIQFLRSNQSYIDLLYLDSYDVDMENPHDAAMHCMFELTTAMPKLHKNSIVFVDDSPVGPDFKVNGKGLYVAEYMKKLGLMPFTMAYQVAWLMP